MRLIKRSLPIVVCLLSVFLYIGILVTLKTESNDALASADMPSNPSQTAQTDEAPDQSPKEDTTILQSKIIGSLKEVHEGGVIDYTIIIRNTGTENPQEAGIHNPIPTNVMLADFSPEMVYEEKKRELSWKGNIAPGKEVHLKTCLVTIPDSAGSYVINWAMVFSTQGNTYLTYETEIRSRNQTMVLQTPQGVGIGPTGIIALGYLIFLPLFILIIPRLIYARWRRMATRTTKALQKEPDKILVYAMTIAFALSVSALLGIGAILKQDIVLFTEYLRTEATVTDKTVKSFTSRSSSQNRKRSVYHDPLVAVRFIAENSEVFAAASIDRGSFLSTNESKAQSLLDQYEIGRSYPCWYDPLSPENFVLRRSLSWAWYILGAGPLLLFLISGRYLIKKLFAKIFI